MTHDAPNPDMPFLERSGSIVASGGFLMPHHNPVPRLFAVVAMKPRRERVRCWLRGEPGFTVNVYDRDTIPHPLEKLPRLTARRGIP